MEKEHMECKCGHMREQHVHGKEACLGGDFIGYTVCLCEEFVADGASKEIKTPPYPILKGMYEAVLSLEKLGFLSPYTSDAQIISDAKVKAVKALRMYETIYGTDMAGNRKGE